MASHSGSRWKLVAGSLWLVVFLAALFCWWRSQLPLGEVPQLLEQWLRDFGLFKAALVYVVLYAIRPLILFPATLLTVASGLIFGPWLGTLFTIVGENASANFAFGMARWLGRRSVVKHVTGNLRRWDEKLGDNAMLTVLFMRLIMLPFDAVNFGCGLTGMRQRDFALGTFIGILPSLIGFVLLGGVAAAGVEHRALVLGLSGLFLLCGLGLARYLKKLDRGKALTE